MMRTLPLVSAMLMRERSPLVTLTSRNESPTLMPVPTRALGALPMVTVFPSPAAALPLATGRFLYMKPAAVESPFSAQPDRTSRVSEPAVAERALNTCFIASSIQNTEHELQD